MFARRFTIVCLLILLFALGFANLSQMPGASRATAKPARRGARRAHAARSSAADWRLARERTDAQIREGTRDRRLRQKARRGRGPGLRQHGCDAERACRVRQRHRHLARHVERRRPGDRRQPSAPRLEQQHGASQFDRVVVREGFRGYSKPSPQIPIMGHGKTNLSEAHRIGRTARPLSANQFRRRRRSGDGAARALRAQHRFPARFLQRGCLGGRQADALSRLLSRGRHLDLVLYAARFASGLWPRALARPLCHDGHAARAVRDLPDRAAQPDHAQSRRAGDGRRIRDADPAAFRLSGRHPCRGGRGREHQAAAARPVRRAGPQRDGRPHRQRHLRAAAGRTNAAGAVHRAARRLFAAPAGPLHRDQPAAFPELRAVHQLPVLCRRVLRVRTRPDGDRAARATKASWSPAT